MVPRLKLDKICIRNEVGGDPVIVDMIAQFIGTPGDVNPTTTSSVLIVPRIDPDTIETVSVVLL
jgi:hypothetical protein